MDWLGTVLIITVIGGVIGGLIGPIIEAVSKNKAKEQLTEIDTSGLSEFNTYFTKVVGVTYNGIQSILPKLRSGMLLDFVREPKNSYDKNAIRVECNGKNIGHLSADLAADLAPIVDDGGKITGNITNITGGNGKTYGCNIEITVWKKI